MLLNFSRAAILDWRFESKFPLPSVINFFNVSCKKLVVQQNNTLSSWSSLLSSLVVSKKYRCYIKEKSETTNPLTLQEVTSEFHFAFVPNYNSWNGCHVKISKICMKIRKRTVSSLKGGLLAVYMKMNVTGKLPFIQKVWQQNSFWHWATRQFGTDLLNVTIRISTSSRDK